MQRNIHHYYKLIRKLGKGGFGSVDLKKKKKLLKFAKENRILKNCILIYKKNKTKKIPIVRKYMKNTKMNY